MHDITEIARQRMAGIAPYRAGADAPGSPAGKLSSNEAPYGPSPRALLAYHRAAGQLHRYETSKRLRAQVARLAGVTENQVVITNGSDELVGLISLVFLERGARVVVGLPCYPLDDLSARVHLGEPFRVPLINGCHDLDAMARATAGAKIVWLPNPHNPTGVAVDPDALSRFLEHVPSSCIVVLDEAYRDFLRPALQPDVGELLGRYPNLIVQRTLSKAYGLAGIRVGYGLGHQDVITSLQTAAAPYNVNVSALRTAEAALQDLAWRDWLVDRTVRERQKLEAFLLARGVGFFASESNFVTAQFREQTLAVAAALSERGIRIREGVDFGEPSWTRITVGPPVQMALVRQAIGASL